MTETESNSGFASETPDTHETQGTSLAAEELLPVDWLEVVAERLRVLAHPVRLHIVDLLSHGPLPVHTIADRSALPPNQACEHLRRMKALGLVDSDRKGRTVYYRIDSPQVTGLLNCIRNCCPKQPDA